MTENLQYFATTWKLAQTQYSKEIIEETTTYHEEGKAVIWHPKLGVLKIIEDPNDDELYQKLGPRMYGNRD